MVELSRERVEMILNEETPKTEELTTILRAVYTRYMRLYEKYFADPDALNDEVIAELNQYHEETRSLVKYYYMDIPEDVCDEIVEFDVKYGSKLLGPDWHKFLFDEYKHFRGKNWDKSEEWTKEEFKKEALHGFYQAMGSVFRQGFDTGSKHTSNFIEGVSSLLFGKDKK